MITTRTTCRVCDSPDLENVLSLGSQYVSDFVPRSEIGTGIVAPLELVMCGRCTLLQLRHTAPQELLYARHYWYRSGVTQTMRDALAELASSIQSVVALGAGDVVLDIGANDGTLLAAYTVDGVIRVGCEPAVNLLDELATRADHVLPDFWSADLFDRAATELGLPRPKVVTAIGMFYDLEDPNQFVRDAARVMAPDGVFVAQLMCLEPMLRANDVGNICHEHLEFYSLESLRWLFERNGLEIFRVEQNEVNGGSYRLFARHATGAPVSLPVERCSRADIEAFGARVARNREACVEFVRREVAAGKTVYVYGASTKGNVILQYYGLDASLIRAAADRSPEKWGLFTIGTWIPIVSEADAREAQPDYFLVLPWAFMNEFYERETEWRARGGQFLVPLPEFRVLS